MDIYQYLRKRELGDPNQSSNTKKFAFCMYQRITEESAVNFNSPSFTQTFDFDCISNWLIAAHSKFHTSIYNVTNPANSNYDFLTSWEPADRANIWQIVPEISLDCVNWNTKNQFFTVTGNSSTFFFVDTESNTTIETINVNGIKEIFQHKPKPTNNSLIAIAGVKGTVPVLDIRTGGIGHNIGFKCDCSRETTKSVAWSTVHDHFIATANDLEVDLWDSRMALEPIKMQQDNVKLKAIIPEIQFIEGTNKLVALTADRQLHYWDYLNLQHSKYGPVKIKSRPTRYKFSCIANCDPPILFMPSENDILTINLDAMSVMHVLEGHVYPVRTTIFNTLKSELYSAACDGNIIWIVRSLGLEIQRTL